MGPFEKVNFHITGRGGDVVSKLISGGGKWSTKFSDCVTVNIVTDEVEGDLFYQIQIEASKVGVFIVDKLNLIHFPCHSLFLQAWGISNVSTDWVYESLRVGAALPFQPFLYYYSKTSCSNPNSRFFIGTVAYVAPDIEAFDKDRLWAMLSWHGGKVAESVLNSGHKNCF